MRKSLGFTLIELIVVAGILSLLMGLLLPSLGQARRHGKQAVCLSNLRQILVAVRMYLPDNQDRYPRTMETVTSGSPSTVSWWAIDNYQRAIEPYLQQDRGGVERDGLVNGKRSVWFDPGDPDLSEPTLWGSFSDNGLITGVSRREGQIRQPAETVYATLRHGDWGDVVGVTIPDPPPVRNPDDPFWASEYFDMCLDPWIETTDPGHPYHWSAGRAAPPRRLFPGHPMAAEWDAQIDGRHALAEGRLRYGAGQPFAFCDGHVAIKPFESTFADPESNQWDIH